LAVPERQNADRPEDRLGFGARHTVEDLPDRAVAPGDDDPPVVDGGLLRQTLGVARPRRRHALARQTGSFQRPIQLGAVATRRAAPAVGIDNQQGDRHQIWVKTAAAIEK
jgi:hypothetical protein